MATSNQEAINQLQSLMSKVDETMRSVFEVQLEFGDHHPVEALLEFQLQEDFVESAPPLLCKLLEQLRTCRFMTICSVLLQIVPSREKKRTNPDLSVEHLTINYVAPYPLSSNQIEELQSLLELNVRHFKETRNETAVIADIIRHGQCLRSMNLYISEEDELSNNYNDIIKEADAIRTLPRANPNLEITVSVMQMPMI